MKRLNFKFKFKINKNLGILIFMILTGIFLTVLFYAIFKRLFKIHTWNDIKQVLKTFGSTVF